MKIIVLSHIVLKEKKVETEQTIYARLEKHCSFRAISRFGILNGNAVCYQNWNDQNISYSQ